MLPRDVVVNRGRRRDRIARRRAAKCVEIAADEVGEIFLLGIVLLECRVRGLRIPAVREAHDVLWVYRIRTGDTGLPNVKGVALTKRSGRTPAIDLAGQAAVTGPVFAAIVPVTLLTQLSTLNALVHKSRAAPELVLDPSNVKLSRRTPRLNSHLSFGRNSSVSELDQNCGTTWLYVAKLPFSASIYVHWVDATSGSDTTSAKPERPRSESSRTW